MKKKQEKNQARKLYCRRCDRPTNHTLKATYHHSIWSDESDYEVEDCSFYSCAGCESSAMLVVWDASYDEPTATLFPDKEPQQRQPKLFHNINAKLWRAYTETLKCYNQRCFLLCAIGLRTLLEGICDDKGAKGKNLATKIDNLKNHFAPGNIITYLHGFRFSGNDATHSLEPLTEAEAVTAIDVMEDLLNYLYDLDYKASQLKHASKQQTAVASSNS